MQENSIQPDVSRVPTPGIGTPRVSISGTSQPWSESIEKVLEKISNECIFYRDMNMYEAKKSDVIYNIFMYTLICLGGISGIISALNPVHDDPTYEQKILHTIVMVLSFFSSLLWSFVKFGQHEQKSILYKSVGIKFDSLHRNVQRQLSLNRSERVEAKKYMHWVSMNFDQLYENSPLMENHEQRILRETREMHATPREHATPQSTGNHAVPQEIRVDVQKSHPDNQKEGRLPTEIHVNPILNDQFDDGHMRYELSRLKNFA